MNDDPAAGGQPTTGPRGPARGTYAEGLRLVGVRSPINYGPLPVARDRIAAFCALIEDGNPSYWDEELSRKEWGRAIAPPAMLQTWVQPLPWSPGQPTHLDHMMMNVPLPGSALINISTEIEYFRPVYIGDTLLYWDMVRDISEEKRTSIGAGHFITTVGHFQTIENECVAINTNVLFRYEPAVVP